MKQPVKTVLVSSAGVLAVVGLVLAPAVASAITGTTTVNANVGSAISITTSGTVNLAITPTGVGSATSASDTVTVTTNHTAGYLLQLNAGAATLTNGANTLAATGGTIASPAALSSNSWGFRIDGQAGFGAGPTTAQTNQASLTGNYAPVPTTATTVKTTGAPATSGDVTSVWYAAKVDTTKPSGAYTGTITYTATTN